TIYAPQPDLHLARRMGWRCSGRCQLAQLRVRGDEKARFPIIISQRLASGLHVSESVESGVVFDPPRVVSHRLKGDYSAIWSGEPPHDYAVEANVRTHVVKCHPRPHKQLKPPLDLGLMGAEDKTYRAMSAIEAKSLAGAALDHAIAAA